MAKTAAAYIRVSTEEQAELSPESQLAEIRRCAQREGLALPEENIYIDEGISGRQAEKRPAFLRMIAAAKEPCRPFDVILLWKFSRFARNQEESVFYKSVLRSKCGVDVVSVTEPLIAGPFGALIERIIEWMDEFYSIRLGQEVRRSMTLNARRGKLQTAPAFGYGSKDGVLAVNEAEAAWVRHIFEHFNAGQGLYAIARELNDAGVRTHRGNRFENRTVEYILRNPVYIGRLRWNPEGRTRRDFSSAALIVSEGGHEPLVSGPVWQSAQQRLDAVKARWGYKARPACELRHPLSGIVRCADCGATLIFAAPRYFKCGNYTRGRCTHAQHVRADLLEAAVLGRLAADFACSAPLRCVLNAADSDEKGAAARLARTEKQLEARQARLREAYLAGVIGLAEFSLARAELDRALAAAREERQNLQTDGAEATAALNSAIADALRTLTSPDVPAERQNAALRAAVEHAVFDKAAGTLTLTYRYAFPPP